MSVEMAANYAPKQGVAAFSSTFSGRWNRRMSRFFFGAGFLVGLIGLNNIILNSRIVWNIKVNHVSLGGTTISEAREILQGHVRDFAGEEIILESSEGRFLIRSNEIAPTFDIERALLEAFDIGHQQNYWANFKVRLNCIFSSKTVSINSSFDDKRFVKAITQKIPKLKNNQPVDASVAYALKEYAVVSGTSGLGFDEEKAIDQYKSILASFDKKSITISIESRSPQITYEIAQAAIRKTRYMLGRSLRMIYSYDGYNYDSWGITIGEKRDWIEFRKIKTETGSKSEPVSGFKLEPVFNSEKLRAELNQRIAPYMYRAKEDITIRDEKGKPVADGIARDGYYLDVSRSIASINKFLVTPDLDSVGNFRAPLIVAHLEGGIANPDNKFGITDVLATGVTDFFGSPANRKFNIDHGAKKFQNLLLEPGKTFSFVKTMGLVDSITGYLKELVIVNGDSSEPNWGGGMCQISSTLFRTVFFAGLYVKKRTNHSYEVKYYAPIGLDATIYDPAPDLIFENDTKNVVLIQNLVDLSRTKMYFKLFGKKDGRKITLEGPIDGGNVGEKMEHYYFSWLRHIEFPDGTKRTDKFGSTYKNKDLVKKHKPDSTQILDQDSTKLRAAVMPYDSAQASN